MHRPLLILHCGLLLLLLATSAMAETYYVAQQEIRYPGRKLGKGSDSYSCQQATSPQTPKSSINGGIACLHGGDTLMIGPGTYKELLMGSYSGSSTCTAADLAQMPNCAVLPNGLDPDHLTSLVGDGAAVISPDIAPAGGGGIVTLFDNSRSFRLQGLRFLASSVAGAALGVHLGNAQYIAFVGNEIAGGTLNSSYSSRYHAIIGNHVHHAGQGCNPQVQTSPPCPHGMYLMGQHHVVMSNYVHHNANYAIQVSSESGGISDVLVARNRVEYNGGVGIRLQGDRMQGIANQLVANGIGMTLTGNGLVAHNTFDGYNPDAEDPFGLWTDGGYTIVNNVFTRMKSAWLIMQQRSGGSFIPVPAEVAHHNGCDLAGNVGCTHVQPTDAWYQGLASGDYRLAVASPAKGAGASGVPVTQDIQYATYQQPDLGAYAWQGTPPIPPEPPQPGPVTAWRCEGDLLAGGKLAMTCVPQEGGR